MGLRPLTDTDHVLLLRGDFVPTEPLVCRHETGRVTSDLMLGGSPYLMVISDRFRDVLAASGCSGWRTYPVDVRTKGDAQIPGFSGLAIVGRAGPPDWKRSQTALRPPIAGDGGAVSFKRGLYFDEETWDGSDIFLLGETGFIIVTGAVRTALRDGHIRNVAYERLVDFEIPLFTLEM